jgi:hypothetical protein
VFTKDARRGYIGTAQEFIKDVTQNNQYQSFRTTRFKETPERKTGSLAYH